MFACLSECHRRNGVCMQPSARGAHTDCVLAYECLRVHGRAHRHAQPCVAGIDQRKLRRLAPCLRDVNVAKSAAAHEPTRCSDGLGCDEMMTGKGRVGTGSQYEDARCTVVAEGCSAN
eukprot:602337-Pleurochrysis_carterae.AAC.2